MVMSFEPKRKRSVDRTLADPILGFVKKFSEQSSLLVAGIERSPSLYSTGFWQQLHEELVKINDSCNTILGVFEDEENDKEEVELHLEKERIQTNCLES
jgi:hypothetical protein